jgi:hypothetical protein
MLLTENTNQMENTAKDQKKNNEIIIITSKKENGDHCSQIHAHILQTYRKERKRPFYIKNTVANTSD